MAPTRTPGVSAVFLREMWVLGLVAAVACGVASCSSHTPSAPPTSSASPGKRLTWMMTKSALTQLVTDPGVRSRLEASQVYELVQPGQQPLATAGAAPVVTFSAVGDLQAAVTGNQLPAGTRAVLYDPEAWSFTPVTEQQNPAQAAQQAASIAHAHGLKLIVAPALNLTTVVSGSTGPRWKQFLNLGLAGSIAKVADVIELQAQSLEQQPGTYADFVQSAAAQARAANPKVSVLAGLSTNPPGAGVSSQQLTTAISATSATVDGYWLNIPGQGARCPACNAPRPDIGRQVLRAIP
jgi:hypothetical protein